MDRRIDGTAMAGWDTFSLTTVRQPIEEIAAQGIDLLLARIENSTPQRIHHNRLAGELIVRGSTNGRPSAEAEPVHEFLRDRQCRCGGGRRCVAHPQDAAIAGETEIVDEAAGAIDRLSTDPLGARTRSRSSRDGTNRCASAMNLCLLSERCTSLSATRRCRAAKRQVPGHATISATSRKRICRRP